MTSSDMSGRSARSLDLAEGASHVTLVDDWGDEPYAPRRILAAALKQLAKSRRDEAKRKAMRSAGQTPRRVPPAAS